MSLISASLIEDLDTTTWFDELKMSDDALENLSFTPKKEDPPESLSKDSKRMSIKQLFGGGKKSNLTVQKSVPESPESPYTPAYPVETPRTLFFNESKELVANMPETGTSARDWGAKPLDARDRTQSMWLGEKIKEKQKELQEVKTLLSEREQEAVMAAQMGQMLIERQKELEKDSQRTQDELLEQLKTLRADLDESRAMQHTLKVEKQQLEFLLQEKDYEGSFKDQDLKAAAEEAEKLKMTLKRKSMANFQNKIAGDNNALKVDELEEENEGLKADVQKLRLRLAEKEDQMKDLQLEMDSLNPAKMQSELAQLRSEAMKASTLTSRNKQLKEQLDGLHQELETIKGEMGELDALKKAIDDKEKEIEDLQERLKYEKDVNEEYRNVIDNLEQERFESNFRSLGSDLTDQDRLKLLEEQLEIVTKERDRLAAENKKNAGAYDKLKQLEKFVEEDLEKIKRNMLELHADGLIATERPKWVPDKQVKVCHLCKRDFGALNRRHHCRHCGKVCCARCTAQKIAIKRLQYDEPVRVCYSCYFLLSHSTLLPNSITVCPELCTATGPGLSNGIQSRTSMRHFLITAVDEEGRAKTTGGDEFVVTYRHEHDLYDKERPIKDNNNGTYDTSYLASKVGQYIVSVFLNEEHIKGSPWTINIREPTPEEAAAAHAEEQAKTLERKGSRRKNMKSMDGEVPPDPAPSEKKKWFARKK